MYFDKFYYCEKSYNPIVTSFLKECGYGLVKGKWLWKDKQLFDSYGISVDYSKRGILSLDQVEVDMFKPAQIAMYKKESQRTQIEVFTDFLDRYRDIAPAWMHSLKNFLNRINPMRFFKKE